MAVLSKSYSEEQVENETRVVLRIPPALAPIKVAIMPLVKKDGLPEVARDIMKTLSLEFNCQYDEKDSIGKRYRRQDAIGTPFCITIDHQTLQDNMVTIRDRDTMQQERVAITSLVQIVDAKVSMNNLLRTLM